MTTNTRRVSCAVALACLAARAAGAAPATDFDGGRAEPTASLIEAIRQAGRDAVASIRDAGPVGSPASTEGGGARTLQNAMRLWEPTTLDGLAKLESAAVQDGLLYPDEEAFLLALRLPGDLAAYRDRFVADAGRPEGPRSPEIERARRLDPLFGAKVDAVLRTARPGDLLFWRSAAVQPGEEPAFQALGWWQHAAIMLADGKIMESNRPEGVAIHTVEASVAKHGLRFKEAEILIATHWDPLTPERIAGLTASAYRKVGKPWKYMPQWRYGDATKVSCASAIWELYNENRIPWRGHDGRAYVNTIIPLDLIEQPVALVRVDGSIAAPAGDPDILRRPHGLIGAASHAVDVAADLAPPLLGLVRSKANRSVETWRESSEEPWTP